MKIKKKNDDVEITVGCLLLLLCLIVVLAIYFIFVIGIYGILAWCFSITFSWKIGIGIWILTMLLSSVLLGGID